MTWLLVVRGPGDLDGRLICGALISMLGPHSSVSLRGPQYGMVLNRRRLSVGFFEFWHRPPTQTVLFIYFFLFCIMNLGPHPKNSRPNPMSFQFLTQGT